MSVRNRAERLGPPRSASTATRMAARSAAVRRSAARAAMRVSRVSLTSKMSSSSSSCAAIQSRQQRSRESKSVTREPPCAPRVVTMNPVLSSDLSARRSVMREMPS